MGSDTARGADGSAAEREASGPGMAWEASGSGEARGAEGLYQRIVDPGSLTVCPDDSGPANPADWPGYEGQLARARRASGAEAAVTTGLARVEGGPCVLVGFNFAFFGGSMGAAEGTLISRAFAEAVRQRLPVVTVAASGGARMQEGVIALVQMQVVMGAIVRARQAGIPHSAVAKDPTTGGVWASLVASADAVIALRGARISFSGSRTRPDMADPGSPEFRAEAKWERGFADCLTADHEVHDLLAQATELLSPRSRGGTARPVRVPAWTDGLDVGGGQDGAADGRSTDGRSTDGTGALPTPSAAVAG